MKGDTLTIGTTGSTYANPVCSRLSGSDNLGKCTSSSIRYKKDVEDISIGMDMIQKMRPVRYDWKETTYGLTSYDYGFIAEEMEKVDPGFVIYAEDEQTGEMRVETVKYDHLTAVLVKAVQELKNEKDNEIKLLSAQNDELKAVVCEIKPEAELCNK